MLRFSRVCFIAFVILSVPHLNFAQDEAVTEETVEAHEDSVKIHIYTKSLGDVPDCSFQLNDTDLSGSCFNSAEPVAIIFHGFQSGSNDSLIQLVKNAFVRKTGWNTIVVDWAPWSKTTHYEAAVNSAFSISTQFGQWLSEVVSKAYTSPDRVQLVGFSIGAHMVGIAAKVVQQRGLGAVAKIFALDPAFPLYESKPDTERLRKEDAAFVQTIHTCGHHVSYETSIGHVDFYPNGGRFPQVDCLAQKPGLDIITLMICSHTIVLRYFAESVVDEGKFVATKCDSWIEFQKRNCSSERAPMGFGTPINMTGDFYLDAHLQLSKSDLVSWMPSNTGEAT